jgi:predicted MFS family arabinose efflux permease
MPLHLFASRVRTGAYATRFLYLGGMIGFFSFTTQYLQGVLGLTPLEAGVAFLPMTVVNFGVAMAIPRLTPRFGSARLLTAGVALTLVGMAWLSRLGETTPYLTAVALPMVLIGAGQGLAFAPMTSAGIAHVGRADAGAASGLVNTAHQLGSALGLGVLVAVSASAGAGAATPSAVLTAHVATALTAASVLLAAGLVAVVALVVPGHRALDATMGAATRPPSDPAPSRTRPAVEPLEEARR